MSHTCQKLEETKSGESESTESINDLSLAISGLLELSFHRTQRWATQVFQCISILIFTIILWRVNYNFSASLFYIMKPLHNNSILIMITQLW